MPLYLKGLGEGEIRFFGVSGREETAFALGRIFIWRAEARQIPEMAVICLSERISPSGCELIAKNPPAAMVISASALNESVVELVSDAEIPFIIMKEAPLGLYRQDGRIALLDARRGVLIVDPSIETIDRYPRLTQLGDDTSPRLIKAEGGERFLLDAPTGAALFDFLVESSERLGAPPISVMLDVPRDKREEDAFCEGAEEVFRAAVYGDLSLMLRGHVTEAELAYSFSLMHEVLRRLGQDGREFNGYIPKGFLISSPVDIMRRLSGPRPDFLCFDIDSLRFHAFGGRTAYSHDMQEIWRAVWVRYFEDYAPECPIWVKSADDGEHLRNFVSLARIRDVYIDKK